LAVRVVVLNVVLVVLRVLVVKNSPLVMFSQSKSGLVCRLTGGGEVEGGVGAHVGRVVVVVKLS